MIEKKKRANATEISISIQCERDATIQNVKQRQYNCEKNKAPKQRRKISDENNLDS